MTLHSVLITGGSGFVGYWMHRTRPAGVTVIPLDHKAYQIRWENGKWDAIVHLAPISPTRVLHYAEKRGARVLYASSGAVYGKLPEYTDYAMQKRNGELACAHSEAHVTIARLFTFVGARLSNRFAIMRFIADAKAGKPLQVWGDGSSVRSYLYGEDLGRWMWKLLLHGERDAYDVGSCLPYTILEVARHVASIIPAKIQVLNNGYPPTRYIPDTSKAWAGPGCSETVGLRKAIERTVNDAV